MTKFIVGITLAVGCMGIAVFIWSLMNTRKKYFEDYKKRKRND